MHVAVLGAPSARGRRVVRDLLERPEVTRVVLAGSDERLLERLAAGFGGDLVTVAHARPTVEGIAEALNGVDVALAAIDAGTGPGSLHVGAEITAFEGALQARVPYVTACEDPLVVEAMLSLRYAPERRAQASGAALGATATVTADEPVVAGMSWTPGLSNLLVRAAAERLDAVREVRVAWSTSRNDEGADGLGRLMAGWSGDATVIKDGAPHRRAPGSRSEQVFFPQPVGWQRVHAVRAAEVATLPQLLPGLESLSVLGGMGGASASTLAQMVARAPAATVPPIAVLGRPTEGGPPGRGSKGPRSRSTRSTTRRRLGVLTHAPALGVGPFSPRPSGWSALRVDVTGRSGGATRTLTYGAVDHLANFESGPLVAAALMIGREAIEGRGVMAPETAFAPASFFALLAEFGIRVAHLEP